jgi:hypothetical protein
MTDQQIAHQTVKYAIKRGELVRPSSCELCEHTPDDQWSQIVAHHWNGYENSLDIWFICQYCNRVLHNRHDGSLTKSEASILVMTSDIKRKQPNPPKALPLVKGAQMKRVAELLTALLIALVFCHRARDGFILGM